MQEVVFWRWSTWVTQVKFSIRWNLESLNNWIDKIILRFVTNPQICYFVFKISPDKTIKSYNMMLIAKYQNAMFAMLKVIGSDLIRNYGELTLWR